MQLYKSYVFKDKDPIIDKLRTMVQDEGMNNNQVAVASGISNTTLYNWFDGETRRPQFCTIMAVATALGYDCTFQKNGHKAVHITKKTR